MGIGRALRAGAWILALTVGMAAAQRVPPVEAIYGPADLGDAELSPSGRWLAVTTGVGARRIRLAVFDLQKDSPPLVVADYRDADIGHFQWVNDERLVFDLADLQRGGGDQRFTPGLFSVRADGRESRMLIKIDQPFFADTPSFGREPLNWNHRLLEVPLGGGDEVVVGAYQRDGRFNLVAVHPLRLNVVNQRVVSLARDAPDDVIGWLFDPFGEPRVAIARRAGPVSLHWRGPQQTRWAELARFAALDADFWPLFVDAAGTLYVTQNVGPTGLAVVKRYDFERRQPEPEPLVSAPGFDFSGAFVVDETSGKAVGVRIQTDAETTVWFDPRRQALQKRVDAKLPGRINRVSCRRCDRDDAVVLVRSWSDRFPGEYWIFDPAADRWHRVGLVRPSIDPAGMASIDLHRIQARDGLGLPVWVTRPAGAKGPQPAVVLVHGGPWVRGGHWAWQPDAQFLASRGYVVIEPEFRGSTGYGQALFRAGWKQWGGAMQDDLADALKWAVGQGWVDGARVCIAGASYGGYATLMGLVRHPDLYRCGIAWAAVTDPRLLYSSDWNDTSDETKQYGLPAMLGDPVSDAAMLAAASPLAQAERIKAPLLLAFGGEDRRVPLEHGTRLRDALTAAGHPPEWVLYPDEGHGWLKPENRYDFARRMEAFLDRNLK